MILIIADSDIQGTLVSDGHCSVLSLETQHRTGPASEPMMVGPEGKWQYVHWSTGLNVRSSAWEISPCVLSNEILN